MGEEEYVELRAKNPEIYNDINKVPLDTELYHLSPLGLVLTMGCIRIFFGPFTYWRVGSQAWCIDEISLSTGIRQEALHYGLHSFAYELGKGLIASLVFLLLGTTGGLDTINCMDICEKKANGEEIEQYFNSNKRRLNLLNEEEIIMNGYSSIDNNIINGYSNSDHEASFFNSIRK